MQTAVYPQYHKTSYTNIKCNIATNLFNVFLRKSKVPFTPYRICDPTASH